MLERSLDAPPRRDAAAGAALLPVRGFANQSDLVDGLSEEIVRRLRLGVSQRGRAALAVPGGPNARHLFDGLCGRWAPWKDVTVAVIDAPWSLAGPERGDQLVRQRLLVGRAKSARLLTAPDAECPPEAAVLADREVARLASLDVAVLELSADGESPSFAPESSGLGGGRFVRAVYAAEPAPARIRLALTAEALNAARYVALTVAGQPALEGLQRSLGQESSALGRLLRERRGGVEMFWRP